MCNVTYKNIRSLEGTCNVPFDCKYGVLQHNLLQPYILQSSSHNCGPIYAWCLEKTSISTILLLLLLLLLPKNSEWWGWCPAWAEHTPWPVRTRVDQLRKRKCELLTWQIRVQIQCTGSTRSVHFLYCLYTVVLYVDTVLV